MSAAVRKCWRCGGHGYDRFVEGVDEPVAKGWRTWWDSCRTCKGSGHLTGAPGDGATSAPRPRP